MHRAAYHFIKTLGVPSRVTGKRKRSRKGAEDSDDDVANADGDEEGNEDADAKKDENNDADSVDDEEDDPDIDLSLDVDASANDAEAMAETLIVDFEPGDTLGKLLAFVNQVRMSSQDARDYLAHACSMHNIKPIELRLWVRSRWGSLTHCLSAALEVQKVCYLFIYPAPLVEY
jgi:hypothetical protein